MEKKPYSAGAVKMSFWFMEFRKVVELLAAGKTLEEIKEMNKNENIFGAPTAARANQIFVTVSGRIKTLDKSFVEVFQKSDVAMQKIFVLVSSLAYDSLFFEFVYEVIREKLILGADTLTDSDIRIFFKDKSLQDERVAKWTAATLKRLRAYYKTMLCEAGLLDKGMADRKIIRPVLSPTVEEWLNTHDMEVCVKALNGVR